MSGASRIWRRRDGSPRRCKGFPGWSTTWNSNAAVSITHPSAVSLRATPMKIAIIGVGAIGGYLGTRLALAGEDVTFIARGANLEALRTRGLRLVQADGTEELVPRVKATDSYAEAGAQDIVVLAMKAHQVEAVTGEVPKLFGPRTIVIPMQNGIPYWYFYGHSGAYAGM